jgi:hypothetical protein
MSVVRIVSSEKCQICNVTPIDKNRKQQMNTKPWHKDVIKVKNFLCDNSAAQEELGI